jgi:hypothetical protein
VGFAAGDTLEIEAGVDIDSIVISWSSFALTEYLAGWDRERSLHIGHHQHFSSYLFRYDEKDLKAGIKYFKCEECTVKTGLTAKAPKRELIDGTASEKIHSLI